MRGYGLQGKFEVHLLEATTVVTGSPMSSQIGRTLFVDDIGQTSPPLKDMQEASAWRQSCKAELASAMALYGHTQNTSKTVRQAMGCSR